MKIRSILFISTLIFLLSTFQAAAQEKPLPEPTQIEREKYRELIKESIELAGENAAQIKEFLLKTPVEKYKEASFLIAHMAPSDLACASYDALCEHLEYAFKTRDLFPWSKNVTRELFLHYVLPTRVTQEPFERWRKYLFERVYPRIKHTETMEEAAIEINYWCGERFAYKPTQARDQGIFENLKRGVGRCEEMMILYICAARSVGIPARACSTPLWSTSNSNHAWVEVWCDGKWRYLGACEPADTLDTAWFTSAAQRAPLVVSRIYGVPEDISNIYRLNKTSAIINTTSVYAKTGTVEMNIGKDMEAYFYVFNFGSMRPFSKRDADSEGNIKVDYGPGEYLFTINDKDKILKWGKVKVEPGQKAQVEFGKSDSPEGHMWLRYMKKSDIKKKGGKESGKRKPLPEYEAPPDNYTVKKFNPDEYPELMGKIEKSEFKEKALESLKKSLGNCNQIANAILRAGADDLDDLLWLLANMPDLDLVEATPELLLEHLTYAKVAKPMPGGKYDDIIWREHVLQPRTGYESLRPWRKKLFNRFHKLIGNSLTETAGAVDEWTSKNIVKYGGDRSGAFKDPLLVVVSGTGSEGEINACTTGILRSLGVPARLSPSRQWVDYYDGEKWRPLSKPALEKETAPDPKANSYIPGFLEVTFKRKGLPMEGFEDFGAVKLGGKYWATQWPDNKTDKDGKAKLKLFPPGDYLFNAGVRNRNGDPYIFFKKVKIEPDKTTSIEVALDMPLEHLSREDLVVRNIGKMPEIQTRYISAPDEESKEPFQLWVFFTLDNEPSKSMLPKIDMLQTNTPDLLILYLDLGTDEKALKNFSDEHNLADSRSFVGFADFEDTVKKLKLPIKDGKLTAMPSVLLVGNGKIIFWEEGFNLAIDQTLQQIIEIFRKK